MLSQEPNLQDVRLRLQQLSELPPLSPSALRILQAVQDANLEVRAIARIIDQDPPLSARLVGLANAAYFGVPAPVTSVEEAIFKVLGINTAKNLALAIVLSGTFDARRIPGFQADAYWLGAVSVAVLAQRLAPHVRLEPAPTPAEAYLAGLVHNIGVLALSHVFPDAMAKVFSARSGPEQPLADVELETLGFDHLEAGGWIARRWHLPPSVTAAVEYHAVGDYPGPYQGCVQLVGWCVEQVRHPGEARGEVRLALLGIPAATANAALEALAREHEALAAMARSLAG